MTRDELILAMFNNTYSTQKELGDKLGMSQREISRLLDAYGLKDIFERNKVGGQSIKSSGKNSVPAEDKERIRKSFLNYAQKCAKELWPLYLEQGGEKEYEDICRDYRYGITDRYISVEGLGTLEKARKRINELLEMRASIEDMDEDDIMIIGHSLVRKVVAFRNKKFGWENGGDK